MVDPLVCCVNISKFSTNDAIFMEINHYFCKLEL